MHSGPGPVTRSWAEKLAGDSKCWWGSGRHLQKQLLRVWWVEVSEVNQGLSKNSQVRFRRNAAKMEKAVLTDQMSRGLFQYFRLELRS